MSSSTRDRIVVITGSSDGIGAALARQLADAGTRPILVGRSPGKTAKVAQAIGAEHHVADFANLDEVRDLAATLAAAHPRLDVLVNNAGAIFGPRALTGDGIEQTLQVDHLAPFLLTTSLLGPLAAGDGVVITTSSSAAKNFGYLDTEDLQHDRRYSAITAYGDAKLANILFTRGLHARHAAEGIRAVAVDPGNIATGFARHTTSWFRYIYNTPLRRLLGTADYGAAALRFFVDGHPDRDWRSGTFYTRTRQASGRQTNPQVHDDALVDRLWDLSASLVADSRCS